MENSPAPPAKKDLLQTLAENLVREISNKEDLRTALFWLEFELYESHGPSAIKELKKIVAELKTE
jgi:hypothetical protein